MLGQPLADLTHQAEKLGVRALFLFSSRDKPHGLVGRMCVLGPGHHRVKENSSCPLLHLLCALSVPAPLPCQGIAQFHLVLTPSPLRSRRAPQVNGSVPQDCPLRLQMPVVSPGCHLCLCPTGCKSEGPVTSLGPLICSSGSQNSEKLYLLGDQPVYSERCNSGRARWKRGEGRVRWPGAALPRPLSRVRPPGNSLSPVLLVFMAVSLHRPLVVEPSLWAIMPSAKVEEAETESSSPLVGSHCSNVSPGWLKEPVQGSRLHSLHLCALRLSGIKDITN